MRTLNVLRLTSDSPFSLKNIQSDPMTVGAYIPQIWGGADQLVRRNLLLNTNTLATQNVTVLGLSYTLYIKGTGSVTLSGTATGTLNGTGAGNRVSLQFTATAGTLTLTVSGSVTEGHLTRTATTDHSYQAITDWTTEVYAYNATRQLPWLRRNMYLATENLQDAYWTKTNVTASTATLLLETAVTNAHYVTRGFTPVAGTTYQISVDVEGGVGRNYFQFSHNFGSSATGFYVDLTSGSISNTTGSGTLSAVSLGGLKWRLSIITTAIDATAGFIYHLIASAAGTNNYPGDVTKGVYLSRMQIAVANSDTPYQSISTSWPATYTSLAQAAGYPISLYSDRAGTIAVDSPETVVGKMLDLSTKGNHLVAPSDAARPLLQRDGNGNFFLRRDGVDDSLNVTLPNYGSNCVTYQQDAATCNKSTSVTLNGATSLSTPAVDYARVLLQGASNNDAKIQKYLNRLAGL